MFYEIDYQYFPIFTIDNIFSNVPGESTVVLEHLQPEVVVRNTWLWGRYFLGILGHVKVMFRLVVLESMLFDVFDMGEKLP